MATSLDDVKNRTMTKAKPTTIGGFLVAYKDQIARALPRHMSPDRMARVALTECRKNPALMKCKPESLFGAIIQCSQLGLEPGNSLGHAYLIPYGSEAQLIIGYRGMIDLARRSGQILSLEAHAVYDGDKFECVFGTDSRLIHEPDWKNSNRSNPDKMLFVYAVAKLKDGGVQLEVMSRGEVDSIRARSRSSGKGPWVTDYVAMALKTVIRRLFKYLPVSIEMTTAVNIDERVDANISQENEHVIVGESYVIDENTPFEPDTKMYLDEDQPKPKPQSKKSTPLQTLLNGIAAANTQDEIDEIIDLSTTHMKGEDITKEELEIINDAGLKRSSELGR
jgi:recombination protein RecT